MTTPTRVIARPSPSPRPAPTTPTQPSPRPAARARRQAPPPPAHVPAGARACALIPHLPAPAAPLAPRSCRGRRGQPPSGDSIRSQCDLAARAGGDAHGWQAASPAPAAAPWLAGCGGDSPVAKPRPGGSGLLRGRKGVPRSGARPSGERASLARLLSDLLISGGSTVSEYLYSPHRNYLCWPIEDHLSPGLL